MNVGAELARARRNLGLSIEEVSRTTKISVERLTAIEQMDAERLPSLIYLKGFLRAYAMEVQLDPEDIAERYLGQLDVVGSMDVASHEELAVTDRERGGPTIAPLVAADPAAFFESEEAPRRPSPPPPRAYTAPRLDEPLPPPAHPFDGVDRGAADPPSALDEFQSARPDVVPSASADRFHSARTDTGPLVSADRVPSARADTLQSAHPETLPLALADTPHSSPADTPLLRYEQASAAGDFEQPRRASKSYAALLLALPLSVLAGWVIGENYDVIMQRLTAALAAQREDRTLDEAAAEAPAPSDAPESSAVHTSPPAAPDAVPPAQAAEAPTGGTDTRTRPDPRSGADGRSGADTRTRADRGAGAPVSQGADDRPATATPSSAPSPERAAARPSPAEPSQPDPAREDRVAAEEPDPRIVTTDDLSGRWAVTNRIEESTYGPYKGMNVGFQLQLQQHGNRVTGTGYKWMENGRPLPAGRRTPIAVEGTLNGGRLQLQFTERGARRASAGTFTLDVTDNSTLSGTFASDAANAQGTSHARRVRPQL